MYFLNEYILKPGFTLVVLASNPFENTKRFL